VPAAETKREVEFAAYDESDADRLQRLVDELVESSTEGRYPGCDFDEPEWETAESQY